MTMKRTTIITLLLMLFAIMPAVGQKRKTVVKKKAKVEAPAENPRFTEMLSTTQRVMVFDSVVVPREQLLSAFYTNREEGRLSTYTDFFHAPGQATDVVYVNELGNKCLFSMKDASGQLRLFSCDLLGNEWSTPEQLKGLSEGGPTDMGFPYMMPDGQTLYFAARGGNGLGGYDIYHTRLDGSTGRFLKPENIGLPFNSEADDFLYVVSEQDSIGFFATTRRQKEGMVCVYAFVPSKTRSVYDVNSLGGDAVRRFAKLMKISDTWGRSERHASALARLQAMKAGAAAGMSAGKTKDYFTFHVDDKTTYHNMRDFRDPDNATRMRELQSLKKVYDASLAKLNRERAEYAQASTIERKRVQGDLLEQEEQLHQLAQQVRQLEKEIRNRELSR